ncbi:phosphoribosylglycinamide formyltransferase [Gordonia crocea]|uniref:Phosphoribosylglycinamide formyltransferase n=1 Tax=Gordonia crocea TaxID=589162 RepID=A0A7I9UUU3_9ACTN|nr:phosphoribosylglycinamide formyltransferase [Gordonia crocea]GED96974.1 phosphoribosylglycinamide formyltransferase [Gordonia crocea]
MTVPVAVLASGTGSLLTALLDAAEADSAAFDVVAVAVDRDCRAAELAAQRGIAVITCRLGDYPDRGAWDRALTEQTAAFAPEWVATAGFMKILGPAFLDRFAGRVVNSHPALLPAFPGAHGVADALAYGVKVTGTTVHLVDGGVDTGPILAQTPVAVEPDDTEETLHERIKQVERVLLTDVVTALATRGVVTDGRKAQIP